MDYNHSSGQKKRKVVAMREYKCPKCSSTDVFIRKSSSGNNTGLYCGGCGVWIKWVSKKELPLVERFIREKENRSEKEI